MTPLDHAPSQVVKLLGRLPLTLYDLHVGRLLGHRFLVLKHRGRRSGQTHRTMLEVVSWSATQHEAIVVAGWGEHANWYQNIRAAPAQEILIANERFIPQQRFLYVEERIEVLRAYRQSHPIAIRALRGLLGLRAGDDPHNAATRLPMIAFQPQNMDLYEHSQNG